MIRARFSSDSASACDIVIGPLSSRPG